MHYGKFKKQSVIRPYLSPTTELVIWVVLVNTVEPDSFLAWENRDNEPHSVMYDDVQTPFFPLHFKSNFVWT